MIGGLWRGTSRRRSSPRESGAGHVVDLVSLRIERALALRERYRYVRPRVEAEGRGWRIVSPNCSRNIAPDGSEIAIAWLVPDHNGLWALHARDHERQCWRLEDTGLTLDAALQRVCEDPARIYWP